MNGRQGAEVGALHTPQLHPRLAPHDRARPFSAVRLVSKYKQGLPHSVPARAHTRTCTTEHMRTQRPQWTHLSISRYLRAEHRHQTNQTANAEGDARTWRRPCDRHTCESKTQKQYTTARPLAAARASALVLELNRLRPLAVDAEFPHEVLHVNQQRRCRESCVQGVLLL